MARKPNFFKKSATTLLLTLCCGLGSGPLVPAHAAPKPLQVTDINGKKYALDKSTKKATVLFFVAHDCPISNAYAPEISRIAADYAKRQVEILVVYADSDFTAAGAREHARQYGYRVPLLLDSKHRLSSQVGATVTPEAAVLSPSGQPLYVGRINNRYATWGKARTQISQHDLRIALDQVLAGKPVSQPTTRAIGCFIPSETK
jgi:peroxiredoxin